MPIRRASVPPKAERKRAVGAVAEILAKGEPTLFAFEAACRHELRSEMCLDGMPWSRADATAADIVEEALAAIGARRPSWSEGQREWTDPLIMRTHCAECGKRLVEASVNNHYRKYCGQACNHLASQRSYRARKEEVQPVLLQPCLSQRECEHCKTSFKPKKRKQKFCSTDCQHGYEKALPEHPCQYCGMLFKPGRTTARFCSKSCQWQAWKHNLRSRDGSVSQEAELSAP